MMSTDPRRHAPACSSGRLVGAAIVAGSAWPRRRKTDPLPPPGTMARQAGDRRVRDGDHHRRGGPSFVPEAERIATFDQDGTLWVEKPMYSQVDLLPRSRAGRGQGEAGARRSVEPFKTVMSGDREAIARLLARRISRRSSLATLTGMSVDDFRAEAAKWLDTAPRPALEASLHRAHLPADAGGAATTCAPTATRPTSSPAAARTSCAIYAERVYGIPPRAGGRHRRRHQLRATARTASRS